VLLDVWGKMNFVLVFQLKAGKIGVSVLPHEPNAISLTGDTTTALYS